MFLAKCPKSEEKGGVQARSEFLGSHLRKCMDPGGYMVLLGKWPRPGVSSWAPIPENAWAREDHQISLKITLLNSVASRWQKKKYNASIFRGEYLGFSAFEV